MSEPKFITATECAERIAAFHRRAARHISDYLTENEKIIRNLRSNIIAGVKAGKWDAHLEERFKCP